MNPSRPEYEPSQEHIAKMKVIIRKENEIRMRNRDSDRGSRKIPVGAIRECRLDVGAGGGE